jgi:hypothetical protein
MARSMRMWVVMAVALGTAALVAVSSAAEEPSGGASPAPKKVPSRKSAKAKAGKPLSPAAAAAEVLSGPQVRNFQAFCDEWMQKLRDRETYNTAHITWETHDGRVSGEYVGYGAEGSCIAREEPGKDPIGKITYRETRYRRDGATTAEALAAPATVLEQTDTTEIFRFGKGRWQY